LDPERSFHDFLVLFARYSKDNFYFRTAMAHPLDFNISLLQKGDKTEFEKIYLEFFDVLFALGFQYTSDKSVAEGIVQDTFLKLWEVREGLLLQTNIKNFLYTLTKNMCLNHLRDQKAVWKHLNQVKHHEYEYAIESLNRIGEDYFEFKELSEKVEQAIEKLPDELKIVFKMSRFEDLKYREIAEKLQIIEKTVEARMTKALKILRKELKDYLPVFYMISSLLS
jgi:RNA polymerase sigma-70 factor (ECF subfamily)